MCLTLPTLFSSPVIFEKYPVAKNSPCAHAPSELADVSGGGDVEQTVRPATRRAAVTAPKPPESSLYAGRSPLPFDVPAALDHLHAKDKVLSRLIARVDAAVGPFGLEAQGHDVPPFRALTQAILHQQVTARGERWRPFRMVASWYLRRATEMP
jgi:hypothetical protein